jgi:hypothetical protein
MRDASKGAVAEISVHKNPVDPVHPVGKQTPAGVKVETVHGLSIYFPYHIPDRTEALQELRKGGGHFPSKERSLRIQQLEADFAALTPFKDTGWIEFIKRGWSSILAQHVPTQLDEVYSAQQCAQNLGSSDSEGTTLRTRRQAA